jgi:hypothetical protein
MIQLAVMDSNSLLPVEKQLRDAMLECGLSRTALAEEAGVAQPVVSRFLQADADMEQRGLSLKSAAKLCRFLGLELRKVSKRKGKKP